MASSASTRNSKRFILISLPSCVMTTGARPRIPAGIFYLVEKEPRDARRGRSDEQRGGQGAEPVDGRAPAARRRRSKREARGAAGALHVSGPPPRAPRGGGGDSGPDLRAPRTRRKTARHADRR